MNQIISRRGNFITGINQNRMRLNDNFHVKRRKKKNEGKKFSQNLKMNS